MSAADSSFVKTSQKLQETKVIDFVCNLCNLATFQISLGVKFQISLIRLAKRHQTPGHLFSTPTFLFWVSTLYILVSDTRQLCVQINENQLETATWQRKRAKRTITLEMKLLWQCCTVLGLPVGSSVPLSQDAFNSIPFHSTPWQSFCRGLIDFLCVLRMKNLPGSCISSPTLERTNTLQGAQNLWNLLKSSHGAQFTT